MSIMYKGTDPLGVINDTDKAGKSDLTSIQETGATASQAISAGTYFYLNGVLVRALTNIAIDDTFTENTNYEVVTAGALNDVSTSASKCIMPDGETSVAKAINDSMIVPDYTNMSTNKSLGVNYTAENNGYVFIDILHNAYNYVWLYINTVQMASWIANNSAYGEHVVLIVPVSKGDVYNVTADGTGTHSVVTYKFVPSK